MFTTIRKHQRWLMLVIATLTIVAFAFLYNTTEMNRVGANMVGRIYGRNIMQVDVERAIRNYQLALALGQFELVRDLAGQARNEQEAASNFIWNLMVLKHEASALGIEPGTEAVVERIRTLPVFAKDDAFDPAKYSDFLQNQLAPRGFTERQLEDVVRDSLRLQEIKSLVESPAVVLPGDVEPALARLSPADVVVLDFDPASLAADVTVTDEELQRAYAEKKESLQSPEKRSVRYVSFVLSAEDAGKKGKDRVAALQRVASETDAFAEAVAAGGKDMAALAAEKNFPARVTPLFDVKGSADGKISEGDEEVVASAKGVAFRLSAGGGHCEIVELGEKGYAVIEVAQSEPSRLLSLDEARADLRAALIARKRDGAVTEKASAALPEIRKKAAAGADIKKAAAESGIKTRELKAVSVFDENLQAGQREIAMAAADLPEGQLGDFQAQPGGGGFAVFVSKRSAPKPDELEKRRPLIEAGALRGKKMLMFAQWLADARRQSGLELRHEAM